MMAMGAVGALSLAACGSPDPPDDMADAAQNAPDADPGAPDAGPADAGAADAGPADAGPADAGPQGDAGPPPSPPVPRPQMVFCPGHPGTIPGQQDADAPLAEIVFPPPRSITDQPNIAMRGVASDATSIVAVRVNGVDATSGDGFVNWQVSVPLGDIGCNQMVVETEDDQGYVHVAATTIPVYRSLTVYPVTLGSGFDLATQSAVYMEHLSHTVKRIDLASGVITTSTPEVTGPDPEWPRSMFMDTPGNRLFWTGSSGSEGMLFRMDMTTGVRTLVSHAPSGTGSGPALGRSGADMVYVPARDAVYFTQLDAIMQVDASTGNRTNLMLSSTGFAWTYPAGMAYDSVGDRLLISDVGPQALAWLDLTTLTATVLSDAVTGAGPAFTSPGSVALDIPNNRAYTTALVGGLRSLMAIDLSTGDRTILSAVDDPTLGPPLIYGHIELDAANGRVLIADRDELRAVDLATGVRSLPWASGNSVGPHLLWPDAVEYDAAGHRLVVADVRRYAVAAVDLLSGDQTLLIEPEPGPDPWRGAPHTLALDGAGQAYIARYGPGLSDAPTHFLERVDLTTGDATWLTDIGGGWIRALTYDPVDARAFAVWAVYVDNPDGPSCPTPFSLFEADASTDAVTALHIAGSCVPQPPFGTTLTSPQEIIADSNTGGLLVLDASNQYGVYQILSMDPATGMYSTISDENVGTGPVPLAAIAMVEDPDDDRLLLYDIREYALLAVDRTTGDRTVLSDELNGNGPLPYFVSDITMDRVYDVVYAADNTHESVMVLDARTGERVRLSF